ncbi:MAG TPA: DUF1592 domain-containing protein [Polyangiaceae bacterium]|nr:DUF1592 domain-containing protein [Polyangiaceae bacterium]
MARTGLGILLLSLLGVACGKTSADAPADQAQGGDSNSGGQASAEGGKPGVGGRGSAGADGEALSYVDLTGAPIYTRAQRLTNNQWENAVTDVLHLQKRYELSKGFAPPVLGSTDFDNNEQVLYVDNRGFADFETGAEAAATIATESPEALAALYMGDDAAGFVRVFGRRAFRRPLSPAEETKYQGVFALGERLYGAGFANGAALVIRAMLQSPHFLYRTELGAAGAPLDPYELASKLSFWLLGTTPSDSLLDDAAAGKLSSEDQLVAAAREMLDDPRATLVMRDFHGQVLRIRDLQNVSKPPSEYDPAITPELTLAANAFLDSLFMNNLGLRELLTSKQAYVGQGLAPLYGVDAPKGALELRTVAPSRVGYFMQVPFLLLLGVGAESNPIMRGFELERSMLCPPLRSPPPGLQLPPLPSAVPEQTTRERVDALTGSCGSPCHRYINPLGFAFEHFDGLGRKREVDNGRVIDSTGSYPFAEGVKSFTDANELMPLLAGSAQVNTCYAKHVTGYALGRDLVESDRPLLESLGKVSASQSLKELVVALVRAPAFRTRKDGLP